jgi:hypothetical protein
MDEASRTIDRHTPTIPSSLWYGLDPTQERIFTKVKNRLILKQPYLQALQLPSRGSPIVKSESKTITEGMLKEAEEAYLKVAGIFEKHHLSYLKKRKVDPTFLCSTKELTTFLKPETIYNLSLEVRGSSIDGITIPYYFNGEFYGFVTRILNLPDVKYTVSIPHRLCFGINLDYKSDICVVEGVFDALALKSLKCNVLGMGDSQPNYFKMWVASQFDQINLIFDNDYAGWLGAIKAHIILTEMLSVSEKRIAIWALKDAKDPEEALPNLNIFKITLEEAIERTRNYL